MTAQTQANTGQKHWPALETDEELRVYARPEVLHVLKNVMERAAVVTAYFDQGRQFALTSILGVVGDSGHMFLEPGPDEAVNRRWLTATDMLFVTNQGQVKIKFTAAQVVETRHLGVRAFRVPLPQFLIRLQRREFFRIPTSLVSPIMCDIRLPGSGKDAVAMVLDISVGGVALLDNHHAIEFEPGNVYAVCRIDLPGQGMVKTALEVRNTAEVNLRNGLVARRAGCRFVDLSRAAENLVQRYIMSLEMKQDLRTR